MGVLLLLPESDAIYIYLLTSGWKASGGDSFSHYGGLWRVGACSGSSVAAAGATGELCFPEMVKLRYDKGFSAAVIAGGGLSTLSYLPVIHS